MAFANDERSKNAEIKRQELLEKVPKQDHSVGYALELYKLWILSQSTLKRMLNENRPAIKRLFNQSPEEAVAEHTKTLEYLYQECAEILRFNPRIEPNLCFLFDSLSHKKR